MPTVRSEFADYISMCEAENNSFRGPRMMKGFFCITLFLLSCVTMAQNIKIASDDLVVEQEKDGGYHLWIKKKPQFASVLLTESTADPEKELAVYALRDPNWNYINGDEQRMLDGRFLDNTKGLYSLIDSTAEKHSELGEAFHIYIPYVVEYGYAWSRSGELQVVDGTYLNIRVFSKPFGDYEGGFVDNPFLLKVTQKPLEGPPVDNYMPDTVRDYTEIAAEGGGDVLFSTGEDDILDKLSNILDHVDGKSLDLVLALDTTESMKNDIPHLRTSLVPLLQEATVGYDALRFGIVLYKDYMDQYVTKVMPFQPDLSMAQQVLDGVRVFGGRDIPEAVYEALYSGIHGFDWNADSRLIILVGDAPPHARPRGKITKEMVYNDANNIGIELHTIILPQ